MKREHWQRARHLVALAHLHLQVAHCQVLQARGEHHARLQDSASAKQRVSDCESGLAHLLEADDGVPLEAWQRWRTATQLADAAHARALAQQADAAAVCADTAREAHAADTVHTYLQGAAKRAGRRYHDDLDTRAGEAAASTPGRCYED